MISGGHPALTRAGNGRDLSTETGDNLSQFDIDELVFP